MTHTNRQWANSSTTIPMLIMHPAFGHAGCHACSHCDSWLAWLLLRGLCASHVLLLWSASHTQGCCSCLPVSPQQCVCQSCAPAALRGGWVGAACPPALPPASPVGAISGVLSALAIDARHLHTNEVMMRCLSRVHYLRMQKSAGVELVTKCRLLYMQSYASLQESSGPPVGMSAPQFAAPWTATPRGWHACGQCRGPAPGATSSTPRCPRPQQLLHMAGMLHRGSCCCQSARIPCQQQLKQLGEVCGAQHMLAKWVHALGVHPIKARASVACGSAPLCPGRCAGTGSCAVGQQQQAPEHACSCPLWQLLKGQRPVWSRHYDPRQYMSCFHNIIRSGALCPLALSHLTGICGDL